jgi:hypothetical protein
MNFGWQDVAALAIVGFAAIYLLRQAWRLLRRRPTGCGGCSGCPTKPGSRPLVSLNVLQQPSSQERP